MDLLGLTPTPISPTPTTTHTPTLIPTETTTPTLIQTETMTPTIELGTGDVQVTLIWYTTDDLDLWVTDPEGVSIGYSNDNSPSGGELDVDANAGSLPTSEPVENIFWPTGEAPQGAYSVKVVYFSNVNTIEPVNYIVRMLVDGETSEYTGVLEAENDEIVITTFER